MWFFIPCNATDFKMNGINMELIFSIKKIFNKFVPKEFVKKFYKTGYLIKIKNQADNFKELFALTRHLQEFVTTYF